jgi:hypothetical protein
MAYARESGRILETMTVHEERGRGRVDLVYQFPQIRLIWSIWIIYIVFVLEDIGIELKLKG